MSHFVGRFYKHVIGNNGRVSDVCQCIAELDAVGEVQANDVAQGLKCRALVRYLGRGGFRSGHGHHPVSLFPVSPVS
jgi:hypothetical protein